MSIEALAIASIIEEGAPALRKVYHAGVSKDDFVLYEDEFGWIEDRVASHKPINVRVFRRKFTDFEWTPSSERLQDLLLDLKQERAFVEMRSLLDTLSNELEVENAIEKAMHAKDFLSEITRLHAPASDFALVGGWRDHLAEQKQIRLLRTAGEPPGIPTGLKHIDFHWDGLVPGRMIVVLGRPGEGKSLLTEKFGVHAILRKYRVLKISPEMNKREHLCRMHTLISAYPEVKKALGLEHSFRNRALMRGMGYNMKSYKKLLEYIEAEMGEMILLAGTHRRQKMSPAFIESRIEELSPDLVIVDPIYKLVSPKNRKTRIEELSDISDAIQDIAETYNVPVVVTNQAHRQQTGKDDAPHKDSSFNSDVPIQEADHVIGVKNISEEKRMILRCSKSRFGQDFRFEMQFHPNTGVMRELGSPEGSYTNGSDTEGFEDEDLREIISSATGRSENAD